MPISESVGMNTPISLLLLPPFEFCPQGGGGGRGGANEVKSKPTALCPVGPALCVNFFFWCEKFCKIVYTKAHFPTE